ncbi:MAG TPA: Na+/H+ antiporter subunit D, partial [Rhodospirillaceae bacterium]|nr:Na+/H+ antiporter subunit D [Rhodospirillaceae bacterium]
GVYPAPLYDLLPYAVDFEPYTSAHVTVSLGILMFTLLGFVWFLKDLDPENTISLDTDWFYRKGAKAFMWLARGPVASYEAVVAELANTVVLRSLFATARRGLWADINIVDAIVNGVASTIMGWGSTLRKMQTGTLTHYAVAMAAGIVISILVFSLRAM